MAHNRSAFPFRWVLPSAQLLVCLVALWPVRSHLVFGIREAIESYAPARAKSGGYASGLRVYTFPSLTPEQQQAANATAKVAELCMGTPLLLNFPVLVVQLPYILVVPAKKEWVPKGMFPETWRALSWPFAGLIFWWFSGRGIEALLAAHRSVVNPRLGWIETAFAGILSCIGLVLVIGLADSTPADRNDLQFMALVAGGLLWGFLASLTIAARILQWRILKRRATARG